MDIKKILVSPEGKTLEFKRDLSSLKQIMKTIISFANTAGGLLIIGMEDNGVIKGIDDPLQAEEQLTSSIADSISPIIMPDIEILTVQGKTLLCIRVAHWIGPFYLKKEGKEQGVYIRLGSSTRQAGPEFIEEMQRQHKNKSFDQLPCSPHGITTLDISSIQKVLGNAERTINEQQLLSLNILTPFAGTNAVTHGGLILFGKPETRQMVLPDARVSCARFRDTSKADFIDTLDMECSILDVIEQVPLFIRRNTRLYPKIVGMKRNDIPAYPVFAIREILINALAHCDYSLTGMHVMVAIFSDRLEIQNPGLLPFGMTLNHFKAGISRIRNRVIARIFKELGLMEEWGSGYKRVTDFCKENGYPFPDWQEMGPTMRVTIYPHPDAEELSPPVTPPVKKILSVCKNTAGRKKLQEKLSIKNKKYFRDFYLKPALEQGYLEMTIPDKPNSPLQKYRLTALGRKCLT